MVVTYDRYLRGVISTMDLVYVHVVHDNTDTAPSLHPITCIYIPYMLSTD